MRERLRLYGLIRAARAHRIQEYSRLTGQDWVGGKPVVDSKWILCPLKLLGKADWVNHKTK